MWFDHHSHSRNKFCLSLCLSVCASDLSHTTPLASNRHTRHFNVHKIWLKWASRTSLLGKKKKRLGGLVLDFTLIQEWNEKGENWQDFWYMNKFYVPKCSYKWSHLITSTQNLLATELHPHSETSDSLPRIPSSFGISWCPLGKVTSCELLNQLLVQSGSRPPVCLCCSCSKQPISALPWTSVFPCFKKAPSSEFCSLKWPNSPVAWVIHHMSKSFFLNQGS